METSLVQIAEQNHLDKSKAQIVLDKFTGFLEQAKEWENKAKSIVVTDESQTAEMQQAREGRLALKNIRVSAEKTRKELKEQALREGKAIDGIANVIKAVIVPIEEHLEKQEKFAEYKEQERKEKRHAERISQLSQYVEDVTVYQLRDMSEDGYNQLLKTSKSAYDAQKDAEKKAEEERIAKEKAEKAEQERIRQENEKLKAEAIKREVEEKKREEEELKKEAERAEQGRKEREAREKAEAELKRREDEEKQKKAEQEEAERQAKLAPDKDKLFAYAEAIKAIQAPEGLSKAGMAIVEATEKSLLEISQTVKTKTKNICKQ